MSFDVFHTLTRSRSIQTRTGTTLSAQSPQSVAGVSGSGTVDVSPGGGCEGDPVEEIGHDQEDQRNLHHRRGSHESVFYTHGDWLGESDVMKQFFKYTWQLIKQIERDQRNQS